MDSTTIYDIRELWITLYSICVFVCECWRQPFPADNEISASLGKITQPLKFAAFHISNVSSIYGKEFLYSLGRATSRGEGWFGGGSLFVVAASKINHSEELNLQASTPRYDEPIFLVECLRVCECGCMESVLMKSWLWWCEGIQKLCFVCLRPINWAISSPHGLHGMNYIAM